MSSERAFDQVRPQHTSDLSSHHHNDQPRSGSRRATVRRPPASSPTEPLQSPNRPSFRQRFSHHWHELFPQLSDVRTEQDTPITRDSPLFVDSPNPTGRMPPSNSPPARSQDRREDTRRVKRRKLDSDRLQPANFQGFHYGKYGQLDSGRLKMEIVSCDGGTFQIGASYGAENILKDDQSVYCTKGNRCNIVLKHQGETAFSLKELVIKAPGVYNYSAPVQEGMVFVSMNSDDLLNRTAEYRIQYAQSRSRSRSSNSDDELMVSAPRPRGRGTQVDDASIRRAIREARRYVHGIEDWDGRDEDGEDGDDDIGDNDDNNEDRRTARWGQQVRMPQEFTKTLSTVKVTTECGYNSDDEDPAGLRPPDRIGSLPFESAGSEEGESFETYDFLQELMDAGPRARPDAMLSALAASWQRNPQEWNASPRPAASRSVTRAEDSSETAGSAGTRLMMPHAKFHVDKEKSKCTIRFDPPVAGRYVLLKMWNPNGDVTSNIDIKAVIAKGYAGPRYFPAVQWR